VIACGLSALFVPSVFGQRFYAMGSLRRVETETWPLLVLKIT
jgi:hypothetical protein